MARRIRMGFGRGIQRIIGNQLAALDGLEESIIEVPRHPGAFSEAQTNDLAEALRRATEDGLIPSPMAVTFSVVGDAKEMHPIVRDEIFRIGYEAIRNACTHSGASRLEIELRYARDLTLRVDDNGTGIDPAISDRGKDGHFGLRGMRERTARIGGKLTLMSSSNSGTEIKLVVPGRIIFRKMLGRRSLSTRIRALLRSRDQPSNLD
jgi:signal transduction histidine kinase